MYYVTLRSRTGGRHISPIDVDNNKVHHRRHRSVATASSLPAPGPAAAKVDFINIRSHLHREGLVHLRHETLRFDRPVQPLDH